MDTTPRVRLTLDEVEEIAFNHPGTALKVDSVAGTAHLVLDGVEYVASLKATS